MTINLTPDHLAYLTEHAITEKVIEAAGIYSSPGDLIVFPWRDGELETYQTRQWPGPPGEYRWQAKPLHLAAWRPVQDDGGPVILVEGTKQALAVASWAPPEYAVYGMQGCRGWATLELTRLDRFEGRRVIVILDKDASSNPDVYEAGEQLGQHLDLAGAAEARFVLAPGRAKDGIDDYLARIEPDRREQHVTRLLAKAGPKPAPRKPARPRNGQSVADVAAGDFVPLQGLPRSDGIVAAVADVAAHPGEDGAALLDETYGAITAYVAFPHPDYAVATTLYAAATHAVSQLQAATRLRVKSPTKQCGKTRLLDVLEPLVHRAYPTANASPASLVRSIGTGDNPSTLILDEMDALLRKDAKGEMAEALRGILNAGFGRGKTYDRYNANTGQVERWPTFAMAILAGIGDLPDTIEDRAVIITMARKTPDVQVARFRMRRDVPLLRGLGARLAAWVGPRAEWIGSVEPPMPEGMSDRAEDAWEPLIAVADAAGGRWPELARKAAVHLATEAARADAEANVTARLLRDLRIVFGDTEWMTSHEILTRLIGIEGSPWSDWSHGRPMTARQLADMLRPLQAEPGDRRIGNQVLKGYFAADLRDAMLRYSGDAATSATAATTPSDLGFSVAAGNGVPLQPLQPPPSVAAPAAVPGCPICAGVGGPCAMHRNAGYG